MSPSEHDQHEARPSRRRFFFGRTLSSVSTNSRASIATFNTILPQYSVENPASERGVDSDGTSMYTSPSSMQSSNSLASPSRSLPATTAVILPPRYSYVPPRHSTIGSSGQDGINGEISHHEHSFPIRANKPWATLHIFSRDPGELQLKAKLPRLWGGEPITGMVELDLESSTTIQQVTITLKGKIVNGFLDGEEFPFLEHEILVYHKNHGCPGPATSAGSERKRFDGKFAPGSYQLPFSFSFPTQVDLETCSSVLQGALSPFSLAAEPRPTSSSLSESVNEKRKLRTVNALSSALASTSVSTSAFLSGTPAQIQTPVIADALGERRKQRRSTIPMSMMSMPTESGNTTTVCPTPPSFLEQGVTASVVYELVVQFVHGRLRPDSRIKAPVTYMPSVIALPASIRRQYAYENTAFIPGPLSDPDGWLSLPTSVLQGELGGVGGKRVSIECTLYLAKPLSYTRGSYIPLHLHISSQDEHALSILCAPKTLVVRLMRRLRHFSLHDSDGLDDIYGNPAGAYSLEGSALVPLANKGWKTSTVEVDQAVWWVPSTKDIDKSSSILGGERRFEGEVHLPKDMKASNGCALFSIEYFIELLPLLSPAFEPTLNSGMAGGTNQILAAHLVDVATLHPPSTPIPVAFTEPPKATKNRRKQKSTDLKNVIE